jgi:ferredoxin
MIGTEPKPFGEIQRAVEECSELVVVGCGGCAAVCHTGGEPEVAAMAKQLADVDKRVLAAVVPERACYIHHLRESLGEVREELAAAQAILVLGCGGAVQTVRQLTEEYGLVKPVVPALNSIGHMDTLIRDGLWMERCSSCGDCMLNETGGICPITLCAKGLVNGPCGGTRDDGTCEANPEQPCAWQLIYERLNALGQLDRLLRIRAPKNWSRMSKPRRILRNPEAAELVKQLT